MKWQAMAGGCIVVVIRISLRLLVGDSEFVLRMLKEAGERFDPYYELKQLGYSLQTIEERVCKVFGNSPPLEKHLTG